MSVRKHDNLFGSGCDRSCCLKVAHLGVSMGDQVILEDVNFHLHCGEITALIGPNGAGKSTLFRRSWDNCPTPVRSTSSVPAENIPVRSSAMCPRAPASTAATR